jgi:predicted dehydrogenase
MSAVRRGAILGFGSVAELGHLPGWLARDDAEIVAVAEPNAARRERARALLPEATIAAEPADVLRGARLDFVDVATPPMRHAALIEAAAASGVHVLCEKPLVVTTVDHRRVCDAARGAGVALFTVHNWRHSDPYRRVRALLDAGAIGPLVGLGFETVRDGCARSAGSDWRTDGSLSGGGILVDHGWHAFYLMLGLVGEQPRQVRARLTRRRYPEADVEDTADCSIEFPSLAARLYLTWDGSERRTAWSLRGRDGEIDVVDDRLEVRRGGAPIEVQRCAESLSGSSHHPRWFGAVIDEFFRAIDDPAARAGNATEAATCVELLAGAYASAATDVPAPLGAATSVAGATEPS